MASTRLGYLAIKKEVTTALAVKPTNFLRFKEGDITIKKEIIENDPIQNNRWLAITPVPGKITTEGTYKVDLDTTESVHWLLGALGSISTADIGSTAGQVFEHTLNTSSTLPSFSIEQAKGNLADTTNNLQNYQVDRAFGSLVDNIKLSAQDGLVNLEVMVKAHGVFQRSLLTATATAGSSVVMNLESVEGLVVTTDTVNIYDAAPKNETDAIAALSLPNKTITIATLGATYTVANKAKVELVPQTPSFGTSEFYNFNQVNFQFGSTLTAAASATEENIENWEFSYENSLEERFGSLRASPSVIAPKGAKAMLKFTKYFESVIDRDRYLAMERNACILTIQNTTTIGASDTNNYKFSVVIKMSDLRFTSAEMPTGTDELYAVDVEASCFYNTTDARALQIVVRNRSAASVYA